MFEEVPGSCCEVLHRLRVSPWADASLLEGKSLGLLHFGCGFLLPSVFAGLSFLCGDLERSLTRL